MGKIIMTVKSVLDFIEETQTPWLVSNGFRDINGTKYAHTPKEIVSAVFESIKADPNLTGAHVAQADVPAYPEFTYVVFRYPKNGGKSKE